VREVVAEFHTAGFCYAVDEFDRWLRELVRAIRDALELSGARTPRRRLGGGSKRSASAR
jgi:hypothetical protein